MRRMPMDLFIGIRSPSHSLWRSLVTFFRYWKKVTEIKSVALFQKTPTKKHLAMRSYYLMNKFKIIAKKHSIF